MKPYLLALLVAASALATEVSAAPEPSEFISEIITLRYARASDVAAALIRMATNSAGATTAATSPGAVLSPGTPANPPGNTRSNAWNDSSHTLQSLIPKAAASGEILELGQSPIIADERTNSLLIYATHENMQRIKEIIARLDVTVAQVLIEAVVLQVSASGSNTLGLSYLGGDAQGPGSYSFGAGAIRSSNLPSVTRFVPIVQTNAPTGQPSGFAYLARLTNDLDAVVPELADDSRVKILQRPRIQTPQGETATLFLGEGRPYPTSTFYSDGANCGWSSIQQLQVGVTLGVTPFVKPEGFVALDIRQQIDQAAGSVTIANVGDVPITTSSEARAKVVVRDGETILLGGLIETVKDPTRSGVPLLKDIPLLGALFRSTSTRTTRNELIVLIRPTILPPTAQNEVSSQR